MITPEVPIGLDNGPARVPSVDALARLPWCYAPRPVLVALTPRTNERVSSITVALDPTSHVPVAVVLYRPTHGRVAPPRILELQGTWDGSNNAWCWSIESNNPMPTRPESTYQSRRWCQGEGTTTSVDARQASCDNQVPVRWQKSLFPK